MSKKTSSTSKDSLRLRVSQLEESLKKHQKRMGLKDQQKFWLIENQHLQLIIDEKTAQLDQLQREMKKYKIEKNNMNKISEDTEQLEQQLRQSQQKVVKITRQNAQLCRQVAELKKKCKQLEVEAVEAKKLKILLEQTKQSYQMRIAELEFPSKESKIFRTTSKSLIRHQEETPLKKPLGSIVRQNRSTSNMKINDSLRQLNCQLTQQNRVLTAQVQSLLTINSELQQRLRVHLMEQKLSEENTAQFQQIQTILQNERKEFELKLQSKKSLIELLNRKISQQEEEITLLSCRCQSLQSELFHFASSQI